ncbi:MAG: dihydrolipoyl dehydrogenase [Thermodesulfobacteriota bacterium]
MYDVLVIGGGPGGYAAAIRAAQLGGRTALVEAGLIGGACVNFGCIPTKVWHRAAYLAHYLKTASDFGLQAALGRLDLNGLKARKDGVSGDIRMGMEGLLKNNGVDVIAGRARLEGPGRAAVDGRPLEAGKIILATGGTLAVPDVPGLEEAVLTTTQALDLTSLPASVLVWGAGPIEVEMACCLAVFGVKVSLAAADSRLLPREDHDTSQRLAQALRELGLELLLGYRLESVTPAAGAFTARLTGPEEKELTVERVLIGGRRPNPDGLGAREAGLKLNPDGGVKVNEKLETSVPGVYAIGDLTGGWMLSHAATAMGIAAAENARGQNKKFPFHLVPRVVWTIPEAAAVGWSEEEAEKQGLEVETGSFPYPINGLAMCRGELTGAVKVVFDPRQGEILGVHIVGAGATELIGEACLVMQLEGTVRELAAGFRAHPTFSESVVDAARDALGWALYLPKR